MDLYDIIQKEAPPKKAVEESSKSSLEDRYK